VEAIVTAAAAGASTLQLTTSLMRLAATRAMTADRFVEVDLGLADAVRAAIVAMVCHGRRC
jgi:hypothetical protein